MSTAPEYLRAQQEVWDKFCDGTLPREHWPKHFLAPATLKHFMLHGAPAWEKAWIEPAHGSDREMRSLLLKLHTARVAMDVTAVTAALDDLDKFFHEPNTN
jgi:hypothetical protein